MNPYPEINGSEVTLNGRLVPNNPLRRYWFDGLAGRPFYGYHPASLQAYQEGVAARPEVAKKVEALQRELLAVARGGVFAETWRKLNAPTEWPSLKSEIGRVARMNAIRREIVALNPDAALYYGWGGESDQPPREEKRR